MIEMFIEEIIKLLFGKHWLIPFAFFAMLFLIIKHVANGHLPRYFKVSTIALAISFTLFVLAYYFPWVKYSYAPEIKIYIICSLSVVALLLTMFIIVTYFRIRKRLSIVIENTESAGNKINAWNELQNIKPKDLMPWQVKKYNKRRLYLRVFLGNLKGAEQELDKYKNDKAFYHFMKAIILNFRGDHKSELVEIKLAEDSCDGNTEPLIHFQIIHNRGVAYIGAGEYMLADDCFKRTMAYGKEQNISDSDLWLNTYYNYIFNKTRITPEMTIQQCLDLLEGVKEHIDIENPKQYIAYSNIVIGLNRQMRSDRSVIDEIINTDFAYLINADLTEDERCVLEATTARMVCTGRLNPELVIKTMSKDLDKFLNLPMPLKYRCFKEIDYMFRDLRGNIVSENNVLKENAHWYIINGAVHDLEEYRSSLPSEAVFEKCYCMKEQAGLLKYKLDTYSWKVFLDIMESTKLLYRENELYAELAVCDLDIMDEGTAEWNLDKSFKSIYEDDMRKVLAEIEDIIPKLLEHPILNEIYLRLSIYCFAIGDIEKSKGYYAKFRNLGIFSIDHFAPWLKGKYSVISLYMFVISYIETVEKIANSDISKEDKLVVEWFRDFHKRNGYFEAVVLGRILGGDFFPICVERQPAIIIDSFVIGGNFKNAWLVIPQLNIKIKCNEKAKGFLVGEGKIFSEFIEGQYGEPVGCDLNLIGQDRKNAIERIIEMIKGEMPEYIVSKEEMNRLAGDSWLDKGVIEL